MKTSIPPLKLPDLDLPLFNSREESFFIENSQPKYWFGDRILTRIGWGICIGLVKYNNAWLYYIDMDETKFPQKFSEEEIIYNHKIKM